MPVADRKIVLNEDIGDACRCVELAVVALDISPAEILEPGRRRNQKHAIECGLFKTITLDTVGIILGQQARPPAVACRWTLPVRVRFCHPAVSQCKARTGA